jgi:protein-S-isoprenylcysteine O-methyltransferase Ste14
MKMIDIPPVWLALALLLAWAIGRVEPAWLTLAYPVTQLLSGLLVGAGLILMALAVVEMRKWRTTVIPHQEASHLVTSGIFTRTRNPIYLGDTLLLAGVILWFDALLALPLVPLFLWWIERRCVIPEEARLRRRFKADWARYENKVRRWL